MVAVSKTLQICVLRFRMVIKSSKKSRMKIKFHSLGATCGGAVILLFGMLSSSAQTGDYLFSGSELTITLNPGTYDITTFGAQGGSAVFGAGGLGAEMGAEFSFGTIVNLTIFVGGSGGSGGFGSGNESGG